MICQISPLTKQLLLIYDIICQWIARYKTRFDKSALLELRKGLEIIPAIGKFHLAAHILECFWKYSLNFIKGAGQTAGEVLEELWSEIDKVSDFTRGMSPAHRQEVIDDVMMDSNWKKLTGIVQFLIAQLDRSRAGLDETTRSLQDLTKFVTDSRTKKWAKMEREALRPGGIGYKIYESTDVASESLNQTCI